jgi:hypothetical protein
VAVTRPLRSLLIGDVDYYPSEFAFGVNQAMTRAGHWHTAVNIRWDLGVIRKRLEEMRPDVVWGHMLLWPPGPTEVERMTKRADLLNLLADAREDWGTKVFIHDGDARVETRCPYDVSPAIDLALCNHTADRSVWKVPQLHWPYFAFDQAAIADPDPAWACDLLFAGRLDVTPLYRPRTELVLKLQHRLGPRMKVLPNELIKHTLYSTAVLAASAKAVLGYGRPGRNGWLDVRVFQYPGAGAYLLHDDVGDYLQDGIHYRKYPSGDVDAICAIVDGLDSDQVGVTALTRAVAFQYVQAHHSATVRVREALAAVELTL